MKHLVFSFLAVLWSSSIFGSWLMVMGVCGDSGGVDTVIRVLGLVGLVLFSSLLYMNIEEMEER